MGYWRKAVRFSWPEVGRYDLWRTVRAAFTTAVLAYLFESSHSFRKVPVYLAVFCGVYLAFAALEFPYNLLAKAPPRLYNEATAEAERLKRELEEQLRPKLEILFQPEFPYIDQRVPEPTGEAPIYKLFRVGVRVVGGRTVDGLTVVISEIRPRKRLLSPPLPLPGVHDRPERKTTELHPGSQPWYFDVVEQQAHGPIRLMHIVSGIAHEIRPEKCAVEITASGRDVPSASRWFIISVPTPRQGNQDLQFTPTDQPPDPTINSSVSVQT
jgi:hypothetical protein